MYNSIIQIAPKYIYWLLGLPPQPNMIVNPPTPMSGVETGFINVVAPTKGYGRYQADKRAWKFLADMRALPEMTFE